MATSGLLVAVVAIVVALAARALRPKSEPLLPPWQPWRVSWSGYDVLGAFVFMRLLPALLFLLLSQLGFYTAVYGSEFPPPDAKDVDPEWLKEANTIRILWAYLFALPLFVGLLWLVVRAIYPRWEPALAGNGSTAGKVWLAVLAWVAITPTVLIFHAAVNEVFIHFNINPAEHPLTKLGNRPLLDQVLFAVQACIAAPLTEELFFRGILLSWCIGRTKLLETGTKPGTTLRPWFVMFAAGALAMLEGKTSSPLIFTAILAVGLAVLWRYTRTGVRRVRAVYATAALFAVAHSGVWPTPIPLFVLALALGWLAVRTNGILVPVIVHGLFNAVSAVYVLRSG